MVALHDCGLAPTANLCRRGDWGGNPGRATLVRDVDCRLTHITPGGAASGCPAGAGGGVMVSADGGLGRCGMVS